MVEGPSDVYICANCVDLAHNLIRQEKRKMSATTAPTLSAIPSITPSDAPLPPIARKNAGRSG